MEEHRLPREAPRYLARQALTMRLLALFALTTLTACGPSEGERRIIADKWEDGTTKCDGVEVYIDDEWVKDGAITLFHRGGKLAARGTYDRGVETGPWEERHADGAYGMGHYVDGNRDGWWTYFHEDGEKQEEGRYLAGKREGEWLWWYSDGKLRSNAMYAGGRRNGVTTDYHLDGSVDATTSGLYADGERVPD